MAVTRLMLLQCAGKATSRTNHNQLRQCIYSSWSLSSSDRDLKRRDVGQKNQHEFMQGKAHLSNTTAFD